MTIRHQLMIEGTYYTIVVSDDSEALLAAQAAGSAVVGLWNPGESSPHLRSAERGEAQDLSMVRYLVEHPEDADAGYLERVVRRTAGLPFLITETERLRVREFHISDLGKVPAEPEDKAADRVFCDSELLQAYIRNQYGFYEYGLWALEDKTSGSLIGKAGITDTAEPAGGKEAGMELGYHIFRPYRQQGYAFEACLAIIEYVKEELKPPFLYIKTDASNEASQRLAEKLNFNQRCSGGDQKQYLFALNY